MITSSEQFTVLHGTAEERAAFQLPESSMTVFRWREPDGTEYEANAGTWYRSSPSMAAALFSGDVRPVVDGHTQLHRGRMFHASTVFTGLANGATYNVIFTTAADDYPHIVTMPALDGSFEYHIYEGVTFTGGTVVPIANHKRTSANTYSGAFLHTPTITDDGAAITGPTFFPGGSGPHSGGTIGDFGDEIICKPATPYLFRITNRAGAAKSGGFSIQFYTANMIPDS